MTLLMFNHDQSAIVVVMDTLATGSDEPLMFMSKVTAFPHADLLVAGTGLAGVLSGWVHYLSTQRVFRDIEGAVGNAPQVIRGLRSDVLGEASPQDAFVTIYMFGIERKSGTIVRYVYRSTTDFAEERYETNGFGVKPTIEGTAPYGPAKAIDEYVALAERVRKEQDAAGVGKIFIGGELIMTELSEAGIRSMRIHTFDDYESDWKAALLRTAGFS